MHTRRLASFLLGVWLGGILLTMLMAMQTSATVDAMLQSPASGVRELTKAIGPHAMRTLLDHEAAEQRRAQYRTWEVSQIVLGVILLLHLLLGTREGWLPIVLTAIMLAIVLGVYFLVTPDLIGFGRGVDFLEPGKYSPDRARAIAFERAYLGGEFVKLGLGSGLLAYLLYRKTGRRRPSRAEVDVVDNADHSHVNG